MQPIFHYLLAPQQARRNKDGMAALRQGVVAVATPQQKKEPDALDDASKKLFEWFTMPKSLIRMLLHWQAGSS